MLRISSIKLASVAAIGAAILLSACGTLERDAMFENTGPKPWSATQESQPFGAPAAAMRPRATTRHP